MPNVAAFAGDADNLRRYGEDKRLTLLVSMIHVLRTAARDEVCDVFCKRIATIHATGGRKVFDDAPIGFVSTKWRGYLDRRESPAAPPLTGTIGSCAYCWACVTGCAAAM